MYVKKQRGEKMNKLNEISTKINRLEETLVKFKIRKVSHLEQLQYSFIEKHNFLKREMDYISFLDDYYSHLNEIIKVSGIKVY